MAEGVSNRFQKLLKKYQRWQRELEYALRGEELQIVFGFLKSTLIPFRAAYEQNVHYRASQIAVMVDTFVDNGKVQPTCKPQALQELALRLDGLGLFELCQDYVQNYRISAWRYGRVWNSGLQFRMERILNESHSFAQRFLNERAISFAVVHSSQPTSLLPSALRDKPIIKRKTFARPCRPRRVARA